MRAVEFVECCLNGKALLFDLRNFYSGAARWSFLAMQPE
jgi:hypothetical protein